MSSSSGFIAQMQYFYVMLQKVFTLTSIGLLFDIVGVILLWWADGFEPFEKKLDNKGNPEFHSKFDKDDYWQNKRWRNIAILLIVLGFSMQLLAQLL